MARTLNIVGVVWTVLLWATGLVAQDTAQVSQNPILATGKDPFPGLFASHPIAMLLPNVIISSEPAAPILWAALTNNQHAVKASVLPHYTYHAVATGHFLPLNRNNNAANDVAVPLTWIFDNSIHKALDSMSGEVFGSLQTLGLQIGDRSIRVVSNRLLNNRQFLSYPTSNSDWTSSQNFDNGQSSDVRGQSPMAPSPSYPGGWIQGYGSGGSWNSDGNAAGLNYQLGGVSYGADIADDESGVIGLTAGHSFTSFHTGLNDSGHVTSHQLGLYMLKTIEAVYVMGIFNYGFLNYDVSRQVQVSQFAAAPQSNLTGQQFSGYAELGLNLEVGSMRFQPFLALQQQFLANGKAFESGGGAFDLSISQSTVNTLQSHLGARLISDGWITSQGMICTPYFSGRWVADLVGENRTVLASLYGNTPWSVSGLQPQRDYAQFGPGVNLQVTASLSMYANYDLQIADRFHAHSGSGGLLYKF